MSKSAINPIGSNLVYMVNGEARTNSMILAKNFSDDTIKAHTNIKKVIMRKIDFLTKNNMISDVNNSRALNDGRLSGQTTLKSGQVLAKTNSGATFYHSEFEIKKGAKYKTIEMNRHAFIMIVMKLGRYKNAELIQTQIADAFELLVEYYIKNETSKTKELEVMNKAFVPNLEEYGQISHITKKRRTQKRKGCFVSVGGAKMTNKEMDIIRREIALIEVEQSNIKDLSYRADELKALQEQVDNAQWKDATPKTKRPTVESLQLENKLLRKKLSINESIVKMLRDEAKALFNQFVR